MKSTWTFLGQCTTVIAGGVLSWLTVTNPHVATVAESLLGRTSGEILVGRGTPTETDNSTLHEASPTLDRPEPLGASANLTQSVSLETSPRGEGFGRGTRNVERPSADAPSPFSSTQPASSAPIGGVWRDDVGSAVQGISQELKSLGASYLLLERLGPKYRVRCDLSDANGFDGNQTGVNCCLEAFGATPHEAMFEILQAVKQLRTSSVSPSAS